MKKEQFYQAPSDASRVKQAIVATYFGAWKRVLKTWRSHPRLAYVDLYSGPGMYADKSYSTPLLILKQAIEDDYLAEKLVTVFNDGDPQLSSELRRNIAALPGIERLRNEPRVYNHSVSAAVIKLTPQVPTLLFADPWGYKGLSLALIEAFLQKPGSDCVFFFNYKRINAGLGWQGFDEPLDAVFGKKRAENLRTRITGLSPSRREEEIIEEMKCALKDIGARCALRFRFDSASADRTSHHLLFSSKDQKGCSIMKDVMKNRSSSLVEGMGSFDYTSTKAQFMQEFLPGMGPLHEFCDDLASKFAGKSMSFERLFSQDEHPTATESNYRDAILQLETEGVVKVVVPGRERRKVNDRLTLPNDAVITFELSGGRNG